MPHFGETLYSARKKAGLTQDQVADKAGVTKSYVSALERNLPNYRTGALPHPKRDIVIKLANACDALVNEFLLSANLIARSRWFIVK